MYFTPLIYIIILYLEKSYIVLRNQSWMNTAVEEVAYLKGVIEVKSMWKVILNHFQKTPNVLFMITLKLTLFVILF